MAIDVRWVRAAFPSLRNLQPIGEGGQKSVFSCETDEGLSVLKVFHPHQQRLDREIEAVRRISSPYVPRILEDGVVDSPLGPLAWLREDFVRGVSARERFQRGALQMRELVGMGFDVISAAVAAEKVRVVHRDIKPENMIIGDDGRVRLIDFGIARILDLPSMTPTMSPRGPNSAGYAAPEQWQNRKKEIDGRADLFSIGVVLYEGATGANPFVTGAVSADDARRRSERMLLPPLALGWDTQGTFRDLVASLTQKYPARRPRSCTEAHAWMIDVAREQGLI